MNIESLVRPNIRSMAPYSSARSEFSGKASVFLDANESPYDTGFNRYPDPLQKKLKVEIANIKHLHPEQIFLGNGSDEAIDLLFRIFCVPGHDNVIAPDPTYGMYQVCAEINDIEYRKIQLEEDFALNASKILESTDSDTKIIFLCSPNNPTGNSFDTDEMKRILNVFQGIVVIDEAYIDFSSQESWINMLSIYPNLVVLQTFSKAWGQASIRLGMAFASPEVIHYFNNVKYPYNVNVLTQNHALEVLQNKENVKAQILTILDERLRLSKNLASLSYVMTVYPSDSNFLLLRVKDADSVYRYLKEQGIIVRNRNTVSLCNGCLRITVGTTAENEMLLWALNNFRKD